MGREARCAQQANPAFGTRGNPRKQGPLCTMLDPEVFNRIVRTRSGGYTYVDRNGTHHRLEVTKGPEGQVQLRHKSEVV